MRCKADKYIKYTPEFFYQTNKNIFSFAVGHRTLCVFNYRFYDCNILHFSQFFRQIFPGKGQGGVKKKEKRCGGGVGGGLFSKIEKHKNVLAMYYNTQKISMYSFLFQNKCTFKY